MLAINYFIFNYGNNILKLSGWGKFPILNTQLFTPKNIGEISATKIRQKLFEKK